MTKGVQSRIDALERLLNDKRPKSAIERQCYARAIGDLRNEGSNGLVWNEAEAVRAVEFFKLLRHWKGRQFVGKRFVPEEWQEHLLIAPIFGWQREDEYSKRLVRRINEVYCEIPRKNGKSFVSAGIACQGLIADRETGPEVYSAASKKDQAGIVFTDCSNTLQASNELSGLVQVRQHFVKCPSNNGILKAISSDYGMLQGRGASRAIIDELHAHKSSETYDAIIGGMGGRQDWLLFMITTAGVDRSSICWDRREYARNIVEGHMADERYWCFISQAEEEDDIQDPSSWWKASPNLGVSVFEDYYRNRADQAAAIPSKENEFRRVHLNQWTSQHTRWIPVEAWDNCEEVDEAPSQRQPAMAGLDCGSVKDPSSLSLVWRDGDSYVVRNWYWMPADLKYREAETDTQTLRNFAAKGHIKLTPGDVADWDVTIPEDILQILQQYNVTALAFDPWGPARPLAQKLERRRVTCELREFRQTTGNFSPVMREFERLVYKRQIASTPDPVLRWMIGNIAVRTDVNGNIRPDKEKSSEKIDGVVSLLMALGLWLQEPEDKPSVYEERGVRYL